MRRERNSIAPPFLNRRLSAGGKVSFKRCQANHYCARFIFGKMNCVGFNNLKNAALCDTEKCSGLLDSQHGRAAFRAGNLSACWRLANDVSAIGRDRHFKCALDFHLFSVKILKMP